MQNPLLSGDALTRLSSKNAMINIGDLVIIKDDRKFPVAMRRGPGYMFNIVEPIEPGLVGIIVDISMGHQPLNSRSMKWFSLLTPRGNVGWIPETVTGLFKKME